MGLSNIYEDQYRFHSFLLGVWQRSPVAHRGRATSPVKMLEKFLGHTNDAFKERLLYLQRVKLDRMSALEHYETMQGQSLEKMNKKVKDKGIKEGNLVLRYNSKLDNTFQKKFQVKWEGPFKVVSCFTNGTNQLANLDGTLHASRG